MGLLGNAAYSRCERWVPEGFAQEPVIGRGVAQVAWPQKGDSISGPYSLFSSGLG